MKELIKNKRGLRCDCCNRIMKMGYKSPATLNRFTCSYCYHHCESITGVPRCHFERLEIGGYWQDKRSDKFTRLDGNLVIKDQKKYWWDTGHF